jgi:hypothetical protein
VSDSLLADGPDDAVAARAAQRRLGDELDRRKQLRRGVVLAAVAVLHVLLFYVFVVSERIPLASRVAQPVEVQITFLQPKQRASSPPAVIFANPTRPILPEVVPQPITPEIQTPEQKEQDALRALGIALACGATRYEYLSSAERKLCKHPPWKMPPNKNLALTPPPIPPIGQLTGAEAMAKMRAQAPPCPLEQQTPCIHTIIYGKGPQ